MADKTSILVLDVDLDCHTCYKKIKKAICKCCEKLKVEFDEKQKKVILSGPFDPEKLLQKLRCKVGCKIIKGYEIKKPEPKKPPEEPRKETKKPEPTKVQVEVGPVELRVCCIKCCKGCDGKDCRKGDGCHGPVCSEWRCDGYCKRVFGPQYYISYHYFNEQDPPCTIM